MLSFVEARTEVLGLAESLEHVGALIASLVLLPEKPVEVAVGHADRATETAADALAATARRAVRRSAHRAADWAPSGGPPRADCEPGAGA